MYGFMRKSGNGHSIFASDYDGKNQKEITSGMFNIDILGVFGDLLYFMNYYGSSYIKQMNTSNDSLPRNIAMETIHYYDLIVVHSFLQPIGESQYCIVVINQSINQCTHKTDEMQIWFIIRK